MHKLTIDNADDITAHLPADTADEAYLQLGDVKVHLDPSTRESRTKAIEQLTRIRHLSAELEASLRVIRVAPEHASHK